MNYFVSILYYFVFSFYQKAYKKRASFFRTLFQNPTEKYIGKNFVCPKHPLLQTGADRPGLPQKFPCILAVIMLYYE